MEKKGQIQTEALNLHCYQAIFMISYSKCYSSGWLVTELYKLIDK